MLNVASNNIHSIGVLNTCHSLQSLDASDNSIRLIEDLSHLTTLKVRSRVSDQLIEITCIKMIVF